MEDYQIGRGPNWKTTKMEDDQNGERPKWKTTKIEDDQNGRRLKWKTTKMEDDKNEKQLRLKTTCIHRETDVTDLRFAGFLFQFSRGWRREGSVCINWIYILMNQSFQNQKSVLPKTKL